MNPHSTNQVRLRLEVDDDRRNRLRDEGIRWVRSGTSSLLQILPKTQAIPVAIVDFEVTATIRLVAETPSDCHTLRAELSVKGICVVDPNVCIPSSALRVHTAVRADDPGLFQLGQHYNNAISLDHAEGRRLVPKPFIMEAELIPIVVCSCDHVVHDEIRGDGPARTRRKCVSHLFR